MEEESSIEPFRQALRELRWRDASEELKCRNYPTSLLDLYITAWEQSHEYCDTIITDELLSHCNITQLDRVLATATKKGWWKLAGKVLKVSGSEEQRARTIEDAFDKGSHQDLDHYILPHYSTEQLDRILATATGQGWWWLVDNVLELGGSEEQRARTIEEACDRANDSDLEHYILPHCSTEQLDRILTTATGQGWWWLVDNVLELGGSEEQRARTIEEACDRADDSDLKHYILPHCNTEQLDRILATATRKGWRKLAGKVLKVGGSEEQRVKTIIEACDRARDWELEYYILPHCSKVLEHCSMECMYQVLDRATKKGRWSVAGEVLKVGGCGEQRTRTIEDAIDRASDWELDHYILLHCNTEQLDRILTKAIGQGWWWLVDNVLKLGGSKEQRVKTMIEACDRAKD
jgi:L-rhamnose mutarotase